MNSQASWSATNIIPAIAQVAKVETTQERLARISACLSECEQILGEVFLKLNGPIPTADKNPQQSPPQGINAWVMEISSQAQRLKDGLLMINQGLA